MNDPAQPLFYLVATPIGNLGDITLRALEVLRQVDFIACEDTRKSKILLKHYEITKPLISFFEHNEEKAGQRILSLLEEGKSVALITSAGTPGISDPGFSLVRRLIQAGIPFTMIPGPSALVMGVVLSGMPSSSFIFRGFPPRKRGPRQRYLAIDQDSPHTLVFYESPHRLLEFLEDALFVYGDRQAWIGNDLTKFFESVYRGSLSELLSRMKTQKLQGEYVVVIAGCL